MKHIHDNGDIPPREYEDESFREGVNSVLFIRCMKHRDIGQLNTSEMSGGECAVCAIQTNGCQCICHQYPQHGPLQDALDALQEANDKLTRLPADWFQDSSLKTWFPFTYDELERLRDRVRELEIICKRK